ncbi:MAG: 30S ribosomal protein S1 [Deltaproteobacteria bacterium]|nr:30S ribosomal protein S1 [Deltaproteobacteria bacterium]
MEENDRTMEGEEGEKSFAELLDESGMEQGWLKPGQRVEAMIVKITPEWVFIDVGGKHEGYLDRREFLDKEGNLTVKEGETVKAYFLSSQHNEKLFTTKVSAGEASRTFLADAAHNGIPVEGVVEREVKGGFEVRVAGDARGFCPFSQMGLFRVATPADWIGKRLNFKIIEFGERGRNIVVSHRAILEEERAKQKEALKASLQEGMLVKGTVVSLQKFGAFVDLGGVQALIPISEIAWEHIGDISEKLALGQEVEATILRLDWEKDRISLSLRTNLPDPWERVEKEFPEGASFTGTVARLTKFGAFVTLIPGVDGLIHISKLGRGKRITHPSEVLTEGQQILVKVEKIDRDAKRISLAPVGDAEEEKEEALEDFQQFVGKAPSSFGSLGEALQKKLGAKPRG